MKKLILPFLFLTLLVSACKKDETSSSNNNSGGNTNPTATEFFSFKADGKLVEMKAFSAAKDDTINPQALYISAAKVFSVFDRDFFSITLLRPQAGWGDGLTFVLDETQLFSKVEYRDDCGFNFKSTAAPKGYGSGLTIVFNKLPMAKNGVLEGTFSGILKLEENETRVTITEGKFKIKLAN